eukprot:3208539-Amphidinium_carterae.1
MIPSPALVKFLAGHSLREDTFYTASFRFDIAWPTSDWRSPETKILSILRLHAGKLHSHKRLDDDTEEGIISEISGVMLLDQGLFGGSKASLR